MCRMLYLPPGVRPKELIKTLDQLEKSMGGQGNGVAFDSHKQAYKGVGMENSECVRLLNKYPHRHALYHTRVATVGEIEDELCHPFQAKEGTFLTHNGHWDAGELAAALIKGTWSDSSVGALTIRLRGWDWFIKQSPSGAWIYITPQGRYAYRSWTGSLYVELTSGALASEHIRYWGKWKEVKQGSYSPKDKITVESYADKLGKHHKLNWVYGEL